MEPLDVVEDIGSGFGAGLVYPPIDTLPFQQTEEALHRRIVGTTAHSTHTANQVMALEEALVFTAGELTAPIRVQNDR